MTARVSQPLSGPAARATAPATAFARRTLLQSIGDALAAKQENLRRIQLVVGGVYALVGATILLAPSPWSPLFDRWTGVLVWGLWWPAVLLGNLVFGQAWCGLLCPDGALTEWAGRWSRRAKIPRAVRWPGWTVLGFAATLLVVHATDAPHNAKATFSILAALSAAAFATGALFGRGRRVWCRYLCPVSMVFAMLARCAPLHFRVDRAAWDKSTWRRGSRIDCPVLIDVRNMTGAAGCHMCGRCSGHRDAVRLAARRPWDEILRLTPAAALRREVAVLAFGMFALIPATLLASGSWQIFGLQLSWRLAIVALLGILTVVAAKVSRVGALRMSETFVALAGLGAAALLLRISLVAHADATSFGNAVSTGCYILIACGTALSGCLAERMLAQMPAKTPRRHGVALSLWVCTAAIAAGTFAYGVATAP